MAQRIQMQATCGKVGWVKDREGSAQSLGQHPESSRITPTNGKKAHTAALDVNFATMWGALSPHEIVHVLYANRHMSHIEYRILPLLLLTSSFFLRGVGGGEGLKNSIILQSQKSHTFSFNTTFLITLGSVLGTHQPNYPLNV